MLGWLNKGIAAHIGAFLAALAWSAFVVPPIAVAFMPTLAAVHCLVQTEHETDHSHIAAPDGIASSALIAMFSSACFNRSR